jgi:transaldolase/glucose-6-phosphate isomerase
VDALERARHPVIRIVMDGDPYDLGEEFFRWEFATAVAGSILGIHPFDQPDVEASKIASRKLTDEYERAGALPSETPIFTADGIALFTDEKNSAALAKMANGTPSLAQYLEAHLNRLNEGDYFALLAYIEMNEAHERALQEIRQAVRDVRRVATCLEFGPRFLHSTGQAYKGGPNTGVFLQITCDDAVDLPVPGRQYTFGVIKAAQARGDFDVLVERDRRVLRVHLGADVAAGLSTLRSAILTALGLAPGLLRSRAYRWCSSTLFKLARTLAEHGAQIQFRFWEATYERRRPSLGLLLISFFHRFELGQRPNCRTWLCSRRRGSKDVCGSWRLASPGN